LPRFIGEHPEGGKIEAAIGRFGPYVMHEKPPQEGEKKPARIYANIKEVEEVFTIGMNRAVELIAQKAASRGGRSTAKPLREMGEHPDGGAINVMEGRYGPYVKWEKVNATIPKGTEPADVTMEMALELIAAKAPAKKKKAAPKKAAAKKTTAKKPAAKKTTAKKPPVKKAS
ncbi:MAG: topoisomerase C-terminal repeat-containing protein, partial [Pseudomonadota bacterium]